VIISAGTAIALGTYFGGWRITQTLGKGLTTIDGPQGFAAQTSAAAVILTSSHLGFALSTTHVVSGGILGGGLGRKASNVQWSTAGRMVSAWVLTLPAAAVVGAIASSIAGTGAVGVIIVAVLGIAVAAGIYVASRRKPVTADSVVNDDVAPEPEPLKVAA
jgi:PiT family inorganic phosphate transporter